MKNVLNMNRAKLIWHGDEIADKIDGAVFKTVDRVLDIVEAEAKRRVPKRTGTLESEIEIKNSRFGDGGGIVEAQGPGNYTKYYASFVEFGTYKDKPQSYMRPAARKGEKSRRRITVEELNRVLR